MTKNQEVLRLCAQVFLAYYYSAVDDLPEGDVFIDQCKTMADLCALRLPMKYRFTREEIAAMRIGGKE